MENKPNLILIDEIQFITKAQVNDLVKIIRDSKTLVFGYGLMSNFMGELFDTVIYDGNGNIEKMRGKFNELIKDAWEVLDEHLE